LADRFGSEHPFSRSGSQSIETLNSSANRMNNSVMRRVEQRGPTSHLLSAFTLNANPRRHLLFGEAQVKAKYAKSISERSGKALWFRAHGRASVSTDAASASASVGILARDAMSSMITRATAPRKSQCVSACFMSFTLPGAAAPPWRPRAPPPPLSFRRCTDPRLSASARTAPRGSRSARLQSASRHRP